MSETSGSGFAPFVPGFEFLQSLTSQASAGGLQGTGSGTPQLPNLGHWVAPTFQVEDLEKRIAELKAVQFWLDQNAKALAARASPQPSPAAPGTAGASTTAPEPWQAGARPRKPHAPVLAASRNHSDPDPDREPEQVRFIIL